MNKALSTILLTSIFLVSCSNNNIVNTNYTEVLKNDLITLSECPWVSVPSEVDYTIKFSHTLTSNELVMFIQ